MLEELHAAGVPAERIEFMMALGTHRPMTEDEMRAKVGDAIYDRYPVYNHEWDNPAALEYLGATEQGVEVWINRRVMQADLVVGIGRIMPIDVCGFTGGGKILFPGCCGEITNSDMHWARVEVDSREIVGTRDNIVRAGIDALARKAGLDFIVNIIMDSQKRILDCVAGDLVEAHREGCRRARRYHEVHIPRTADIVVVDGAPFDIEFWQVNKAVDTAGLGGAPGGRRDLRLALLRGVLAHPRRRPAASTAIARARRSCSLVASGEIEHKVVGVHMVQVAEVAVDKATLYLVTVRHLARGCGACGAALCRHAPGGAGPGPGPAWPPGAGGGAARRRRDATRAGPSLIEQRIRRIPRITARCRRSSRRMVGAGRRTGPSHQLQGSQVSSDQGTEIFHR